MTPRSHLAPAVARALGAIAADLFTATAAVRAETTAAMATASLGPFLQSWREAAAQPGGEAIADLTAWPFLFQGRALQRKEFVAKAVPALFTPAVRRCLRRAEPLAEDGRQILSCAPYGFVFAPTAAGWRLVEFFAETP